MKFITLVIATTMLLLLTASPASGQDPEYSREGADSCLSCHDDDAVLALFKGAHGNPADSSGPFGHGQLQCEACHGPSGDHAGRLQCEACHGPSGDHAGRVRRGQERPAPNVLFGSDSSTAVSTQNGFCIDCHIDDTGFGWHGNDHDTNEIACADCHSSHTAQDPVLVTSTQAEVCFDCHQQQRTQSLKPYVICSSHSKRSTTPVLIVMPRNADRTFGNMHRSPRIAAIATTHMVPTNPAC
jgi:predicted CXXCH cytochrome family protein